MGLSLLATLAMTSFTIQKALSAREFLRSGFAAVLSFNAPGLQLLCVLRAGQLEDRSQVSYSLVGSPALKAFSICSALGTIAFSFGDVSHETNASFCAESDLEWLTQVLQSCCRRFCQRSRQPARWGCNPLSQSELLLGSDAKLVSKALTCKLGCRTPRSER